MTLPGVTPFPAHRVSQRPRGTFKQVDPAFEGGIKRRRVSAMLIGPVT